VGIAFDYEGEVTAQDAEEILQKIQGLHAQALTAAPSAVDPGTRGGSSSLRDQPA
jgi:hypothetical protein